MKRRYVIALIVVGAMLGIGFLLQVPIWQEDAKVRKEKVKIRQLIAVGQDLDQAEAVLISSGYQLYYDDAIKPTYDESYYSQLVIVGQSRPMGLESLAYAIDLSWMPFTRSESAYLMIEADLDRTITDID